MSNIGSAEVSAKSWFTISYYACTMIEIELYDRKLVLVLSFKNSQDKSNFHAKKVQKKKEILAYALVTLQKAQKYKISAVQAT